MNENTLNYHHRVDNIQHTPQNRTRREMSQEQGRLVDPGVHKMSTFMLENVKIAEFFQHADLRWCKEKLEEIFEDSNLTFDLDAACERPICIFKTPAWNAAAILLNLARGEKVYTLSAQRQIRGNYSDNRGDGVVVKLKQRPTIREPYQKENYLDKGIENKKTREKIAKKE